MKRLTALIITMAIALSSSMLATAQETKLTRCHAVEIIVNALYQAETAFSLEDYYCLHPGEGGSVHFVPDEKLMESGYPILCEIYSTVSGSKFSDINEESGNLSIYITLAKAMGIIAGCGDNTFRPDKSLTYNEAVKMLVCALGNQEYAKTIGGYPDGYVKAAEEIGITAGISFDGKNHISPDDFTAMVENALKSPSLAKLFMAKFTPPATTDDCVKTFAEAVRDRNGVMQYALYADELKEKTRGDFVELNWVTGVSSPWVTGFDITPKGNLAYDVSFHYATSAGPCDDEKVSLKLSQVGDVFRITEVKQHKIVP